MTGHKGIFIGFSNTSSLVLSIPDLCVKEVRTIQVNESHFFSEDELKQLGIGRTLTSSDIMLDSSITAVSKQTTKDIVHTEDNVIGNDEIEGDIEVEGDILQTEGEPDVMDLNSDNLMQVDTEPEQSLPEIEGEQVQMLENLEPRRSGRQRNQISYTEEDVEWQPSFGRRPDNKDEIWHEDSSSEEEDSYFADIMEMFQMCNTASLEDVYTCAKDAAKVQALVSQQTQKLSHDMTNSNGSSQCQIRKNQDPLEDIQTDLMEHKTKSTLVEPKSFKVMQIGRRRVQLTDEQQDLETGAQTSRSKDCQEQVGLQDQV